MPHAPYPLSLAPTRLQVFHLLRHDLASLKPFFPAWLLVLAAQAGVFWMGPPIPDGTTGPAMSLDVAAFVIRLTLTVVFVAALVARHPATGTTAFWRTRPIRRGDLLLSLLLTTALVAVLIPSVAMGLMFMGLGLAPGVSALAAVRIASEQAVAAALALTLSALTSNMARAIVVGLAAALALAIGVTWAAGAPKAYASFALEIRANAWTPVLAQCAATIALLLPAINQFLTSKTRTSYTLAILLMAAAVLATRNPFFRWLPHELPPADLSLVVPAVPWDAGSVRTGRATQATPGAPARTVVTASALFEPTGPPESLVVRPMSLQSRLRYADGERIDFDTRTGIGWVDGAPETRASTQPWAAMTAALGGIPVRPSGALNDERFRVTFVQVHPDAYDRRRADPAKLLMNLTSEVYQYEVAAHLPLVDSATARTDDYVVGFEGLASEGRALRVLLHEVSVQPWHEPRPITYVLVNPTTRQALVGGERLTERFRASPASARPPIIQRHSIAFATDSTVPSFTQEWLKDAYIAVLRTRALGRIVRGLVVDDYRLEQRPTLAAPKLAEDRVLSAGERRRAP